MPPNRPTCLLSTELSTLLVYGMDQDIADLTGGTVISEDIGLKLEKATLENLGRCRKATITKVRATCGLCLCDVCAHCPAF